MLLTLAVNSLRSLLAGRGERKLETHELPAFVHNELGLHGLSVPASFLRGWSIARIEGLRDEADKAACPCLLLVDDEPLEFGSSDEKVRVAAATRLGRLAAAANRLGCSAIGVGCRGKDTTEVFDRTVSLLKASLQTVDRLELNVLLRPCSGLTEDPTRLTDLIKRIGGFRVGSLPEFAHADKTGNAEGALRKLAPYAGAIHATVEGFDRSGAHTGADLSACVNAIRSVGYQNTLSIDYTGTGDAVADIKHARDILAAAISGDEEDESLDLAAMLGEELDGGALEEEAVEGEDN